jgi:hypothetical protein
MDMGMAVDGNSTVAVAATTITEEETISEGNTNDLFRNKRWHSA